MKTSTSVHCLCIVVGALLASPASFAVTPREYDSLILQARSGNYEPALIMLRQQGIDHPQDLRAAYDHVLIASWAGRTPEVISAYEAIQPAPNHPPADVLLVIARAYRDTQRWDEALDKYELGRRLYPGNASFGVGEVMTLTDAGRPEQAIVLGNQLVDAVPEDADARLALSYAYRGKAVPYPALQATDQARRIAPGKSYVTREYIDALNAAGLSEAALSAARQVPELIGTAELRALEADYVAGLVRLASMPARLESERYAIADRALAEYDRLIPEWEAMGPEGKRDAVRLRVDRLQALHARRLMPELIASYEQLVSEGVTIPRYALNDIAAAYLDQRRPEKAAELYRQVLNDESAKRDTLSERLANETGLFYSLIESEQFDEATEVINAAVAAQPPFRFIRGVPQKVPNDPHLYAQQTEAMNLFYADDTPGAEKRLKELSDAAPTNVSLRAALATVYRARGWPRRSEMVLKSAEALEPRVVDVIAGQGHTALELQEWRQAQTMTDDLSVRLPRHPDTRRLQRDWELYRKAELRVEARRGITNDSPVSGSGDMSIESVVYSAPLDYDWRAFGGGGYATGDFEEGTANHRWLRTGVEYRARDITAELEASVHNYGYGTKPGARASIAYDLSDQWQVGGTAEWRSSETPLRALGSNITSNTVGAFVRWRESDHREWRFALAPSRFSDGNNRIAAVVNGRERLYTSPHLKADLEISIAASRNTKEDVPYFNPRSDFEVLPTVNLTHVLYRHYETVWEQSFLIGAGTYTQQGHGTGAIGAVGYGMRYRYNNMFDVGANVVGISRPYDGVRERDVRVMLQMNIRF